MKFIGVVVTIFPLIAIAGTKISVESAIELALKASEEIQVKKGEEQKSKFRYFEAKGALLPKISYVAKWTKNYSAPTPAEIGDPSKEISPLASAMNIANRHELSHTLQISQPLFTFGQIYHGIAAAKKGYLASKYDVEATRQDVVYNTKVAYYSVLLAQNLLDISEKSLKNAKNNKRLLKKRFSRGRPPQSDNIKMAADVATRLPQVKNAEVQLESALLNLKMMLDIDAKDDVALIDQMETNLPDFDFEILEKNMKQVEPKLKMLDAAVIASNSMVKQKKASLFPTLGAFAAYKYFGSGNDVNVGHSNMDDIFAVGVQFTLPLWTGGQKISQYKHAIADRSTAQAQRRQLQKGLRLQLRNAYSQYKMYLATYQANIEAERLARKSFSMSKNRFRTGHTSVSELNDGEKMLTGAKMQKIMTLFNIHNVWALITKLTTEYK